MKRILLALLLLVMATISIPPLRERAAPHASAAASWTGDRLEGPLSPVVNPYRKLKTQSELSRIINQLSIWRNRGMPAPTGTFDAFIVQREASRTGADAWGTPYLLERRGDSLFIRSAGPDLEPGTPDDLEVGMRYPDRGVRRRPGTR